MNLGIHDAMALGRALSGVLESGSTELLEAYAEAQRPIAKNVIDVTDMLTKLATTNERLREIRNVIVDVLDPMIRTRLAWRLSMLGYEKEIRENIQLT